MQAPLRSINKLVEQPAVPQVSDELKVTKYAESASQIFPRYLIEVLGGAVVRPSSMAL